jgi:tape measure domain-containing protein
MMAGKRLTWIFELFDKMSRPAKAISTHLDDLDRKVKAATGHTKTFDDVMNRFSGSSRKAGDGMGWFGLKLMGWIYTARTALSVVSSLGRGIGGLMMGFGRAGLEAAGFKESATVGLGVLLGGKGPADRVLRQAVKFAAVTPFETKSTIGWTRDLVAAGFKQDELFTVLQGAGDVAALRDFDPQVVDRIITVFRQIKGKGRLQAEELMQLAEVGLPIGKVYETIGKQVGMSALDLQSPKNAGRISADLGIWGILETIRNNISGGKLGNVMEQMSGTMPGLLSTLQSRPFEFLMDLDKSEGFQSFKKALKNLVDVLDPETPAGKRIKKNAEDLFNRIFGGIFKRFEDPGAVEKWVADMMAGFEKLIPRVGELATKIGDVAQNLSKVANVIDVIVNPGKVGTAAGELFGFGGHKAVEGGEKGFIVSRIAALRGKGKLSFLERSELNMLEERAKGLGFTVPTVPPPPAAKPGGKPTSMRIEKGAFQFQISGAQDPKAVGDEVRAALTSAWEQMAAEAGT